MLTRRRCLNFLMMLLTHLLVTISPNYPIAFGLPATVPIPVRSGPQGSVTILYCAWSFVTKKSSKTKRNAGLFSDFFFDALWHLGCRKSVEICSTSSQKSVKREAWGGSGGSGRSPWRHLGPKMAQSSKKHSKRRISTYPPGDQWGTKI